MPNLLAMQQAGTTMSRYYVVDSLCCPSRSAIFTGQYPHDDGVFTNAGHDGGYFAFNQHGDQQKSFALALHKAGYRTAMMGKYLNQYQPAYPEPPGWDEWDAAGNAYGEFGYNLKQNGLHMGEYTRASGKQTAFETDIRVPLIVSGPGVPAGRVVSQLPSSIDLAPTFETLAGLPVPAGVDGHSLAGLWHGQDPAGWPLAVLIEHHGPDFSPDDPDRQTS